ncbi:hypothetical protein [Dactylosporangium sp. CA-233914]|uniref:hypothetical protein n=1 Tax=Dactylosporangium sp. CA-233914 TaxID=3239934 RepID=UPI003D8CBEBB
MSVVLSIPAWGRRPAYFSVLFDALVKSLADLSAGANLAFDANVDDGESITGSFLFFDFSRIAGDIDTWLELRVLTLGTPHEYEHAA